MNCALRGHPPTQWHHFIINAQKATFLVTIFSLQRDYTSAPTVHPTRAPETAAAKPSSHVAGIRRPSSSRQPTSRDIPRTHHAAARRHRGLRPADSMTEPTAGTRGGTARASAARVTWPVVTHVARVTRGGSGRWSHRAEHDGARVAEGESRGQAVHRVLVDAVRHCRAQGKGELEGDGVS